MQPTNTRRAIFVYKVFYTSYIFGPSNPLPACKEFRREEKQQAETFALQTGGKLTTTRKIL